MLQFALTAYCTDLDHCFLPQSAKCALFVCVWGGERMCVCVHRCSWWQSDQSTTCSAFSEWMWKKNNRNPRGINWSKNVTTWLILIFVHPLPFIAGMISQYVEVCVCVYACVKSVQSPTPASLKTVVDTWGPLWAAMSQTATRADHADPTISVTALVYKLFKLRLPLKHSAGPGTLELHHFAVHFCKIPDNTFANAYGLTFFFCSV